MEDRLFVGDLYAETINGVETGRYYCDLGRTGYRVDLTSQFIESLGVPRSILLPTGDGRLGSIYTDYRVSMGKDIFIVE